MHRRTFIIGLSTTWLAAQVPVRATVLSGQRLAQAARKQLGVTTGYDPRYTRIAYPNGDVPRSTGVCADVVVRAARDAFALDLQKLVHEDMARAFDVYPARRVWGNRQPDTNIDHRRVLNLQMYWQRVHAQLWSAAGRADKLPGDGFANLQSGDIVTWLLDARLPTSASLPTSPSSQPSYTTSVTVQKRHLSPPSIRTLRLAITAGLFEQYSRLPHSCCANFGDRQSLLL